jgi:hypothetical protein
LRNVTRSEWTIEILPPSSFFPLCSDLDPFPSYHPTDAPHPEELPPPEKPPPPEVLPPEFQPPPPPKVKVNPPRKWLQ